MSSFVVAVAILVVSQSPGLADHPAEAEDIWNKCSACHEVGPEAMSRIGPHLNGLVGRVVGTEPGFSYSPAMTAFGASGAVWNDETLDAFLSRPKEYITNTTMPFAGLRKEKDRRALIAYLKHFSAGGSEEAPDPVQARRDPEVPAEILAIKGDTEYGQYLSGNCVGCHQASGEDQGIPSITGWPVDAFITVMFAYRSKFRENPVMQQVAGSLSDEEIAALAAYFAEQN